MNQNSFEQLNVDQVVFWEPEDGRVFENGVYALDTETELLDAEQPQKIPRMVIAAVYNGEKAYFLITRTIADFLQIHADLIVVMHNAAFDLAVINQEIAGNFDVYSPVEAGKVRDTQILHRLYDLATTGSGELDGSSLEKSCRKHLGIEVEKDIKDESGQSVRKNFGPWLNRPSDLPPIYLEYLLGDVSATYQLYLKFHSLYKQLWGSTIRDRPFGFIDESRLREAWEQHGSLTHHIQLKGAIVLDVVTRNGLPVDKDQLAVFRHELQEEQKTILEGLLKYEYRPGKGSSKTLQNILEQEERKNGICFLRTNTGKISTKAEHLEPYKESLPFIGLYLRFQKNEKRLGSFLDKMQKGVMHPTFDILKNTGRTSAFGDISSQNLPRDEKVRNLFVASPGHVLISADFNGYFWQNRCRRMGLKNASFSKY